MAQVPVFTLLQAVNTLLRSVTQFQLTTYPNANPGPDETAAAAAINEALVELQSKDQFSWSTQGSEKFWPTVKTLEADASGYIPMYPGTGLLYYVMQAALHPIDADYGKKIVDVRIDSGVRRLFDVTNGTFLWGALATKTLVLTYSLDFESLPPPAQLYVMHAARVRFIEGTSGDQLLLSKAVADKQQAFDALEAWDFRQDPPTFFDAEDLHGMRVLYGGSSPSVIPR